MCGSVRHGHHTVFTKNNKTPMAKDQRETESEGMSHESLDSRESVCGGGRREIKLTR